MNKILRIVFTLILILVALPIITYTQENGSVKGKVIYEHNGNPLHNVSIQIVQLRRMVETDEEGTYEFTGIKPGTYTLLAHLEGFPDIAQTVTVTTGNVTTFDFKLRLSGLREQVTVTATGNEQSTLDALQSVNVLDSTRLAEESHPAIGEVLEKEPGIAKRSFGPGSSRPVIRGFDGDRVLVLQDGMRIGSLGSQSGDHGEPIDVLSLERLEMVKGPATLLYGSSAIGGVVNAVTGRDEHRHEGWRGYLTGIGSTNNNQAGLAAGVEYGYKNWLLWGNGTGQRTADYNTPIGEVINSKTRVGNGSGGFGYFGDKGFFSSSYSYDNRRYGIPFASEFHGHGHEHEEEEEEIAEEGELVDLSMRRHNFRVNGGFRNLDSFVSGMRLSIDYSNYKHQELEGTEISTTFNNKLFSYRGLFDQRRHGRFSGSFGFEGLSRDYETVGEESLITGSVDQNMVSFFTLQEIDFERVKFQVGGRIENNRYKPTTTELPNRSFTGFSGAAGLRLRLWEGGAFVSNYTHSYRAPALEELYSFGPHIGTLSFEIGNPALNRELSNGVEFSLRHTSSRIRAEGNFYIYDLEDFVSLAPIDEDGNGSVDIRDGLPSGEYLQADSRFVGAEVRLDIGLHRNFWINLGMDVVDAEFKKTNIPLPRIPPLRGRIGFDARYKALSIRPELILSSDQEELFPTETRTAGYAVFNLLGSYTIARQHHAHIFSFNAFNLGDRLYRNHLSFIKELAPEIGRGMRATYTIRFF
jgi:iron complex outermembrane recepter protein